MADIRMAVGETLPTFDATLTEGGVAVDLTNATVTFDLTKHGRGYINDAAVTVIDAPTGQVRYTWATDDLTETGTYTGTFKAAYPGPTIEYFEFVVDVIDGEGIQPAPTPPVPTTYVLSVNGRTGVVTGVLDAAANLSDVASASLSRDNLGLGNSATRDVGTTAGTVAAGDDSRFTDPPTGAAGGVLGGTYPNPTFAVDMATQAELNAGLLTRSVLHRFPNRTDTALTFDAGTRAFTISPTGADFTFHIQGVLYTKSAPEGLTVAATDGPHYIYYDSSGVLTESTSPWNILTDVPVALVVWSTTANSGFLCEERHTEIMDAATHDYLHATRGTQLKSRPALTGYTLSPAVPADADNTPAISADGILADEDIYTSLAAVSDGGGVDGYTVLWRTGAAEWTWTTSLTVPFVSTVAGYINANTLSGTWSQTQLANNQYVNYWVLAVPAATTRYQYLFIPGQQIHTSLANAQAESVGASLVLTGLPFTEFAFTHRLTFRTSNTYTSTGKCRLEGVSIVVESVANITAATATAAASVTNVPSGNIAATNVQAALNELDSEKVAKAGDSFTGTLAGTLAAATTDALTLAVTADTNPRFVVNADGGLEWGPGNAITDAVFYRRTGGVLKTDTRLESAGSLGVGAASATTRLINVGGSVTSTATTTHGIMVVNITPATTTLLSNGVYSKVETAAAAFTLTEAVAFRLATPTAGAGSTITSSYGIKVDPQTVGTNGYGIAVEAASTQTLWVGSGADSTTAAAGIAFGSSRDVTLYRGAADRLVTDDDVQCRRLSVGAAPQAAFLGYFAGTHPSTAATVYGFLSQYTGPSTATSGIVGAYMQARSAAASFTVASLIGMQIDGPSVGSGSTATNVYGLKIEPQTGGGSSYGAAIGASTTATLWLSSDANSTTAAGGIAFGSSRDTNLYRSAADTLKTDDNFVAAGTGTFSGASLTIGTNPASTGAIRLANDASVSGRNQANSSDIPAIKVNTGNGVTLRAGEVIVESTGLTIGDGKNVNLATTTGTKIGSNANQKLSLWNATPDVQPTTGITAATFAANTSGIVNDTATYGGYTMGQVVAALQRIGALA